MKTYHEINITEIKNTLKKAKIGKSAGPDMISNEMLKFGGDTLHLAINHLFNIIMCSGKYPEKWKLSLITPIHKSLDINNPVNYRGIAVADCLSKVFCKILNDRIIEYLKSTTFWKPNQNGFMEKT